MSNDGKTPNLGSLARVDRRWGAVFVIWAAIAAGCRDESDPAGKVETSRSQLLVPGQVDPIRVQAIFVSRNDGTLPPAVTGEMVREDLKVVSQVYAPASIRFEFDPQSDVAYV